MNDDRSLERAARSWLEDGPSQAPDHAVDAALLQIETTSQERDLRIPWRFRDMTTASRTLAGVATVVVALVVGVFLVGPGFGPGIGGSPTPSPAPTPSPVPSAALPSATPNLGACRLVTSTEVAEIAGDPGLGALPVQSGTGDSTTCIYSDGGGNLVLRLEQTRVGGALAFQASRDRAGVEAIAALGDAAVYDPASFTLYVLQGDALVAIVARGLNDVPADRFPTALIIAQLVVDRL